jgi:sugar phosphate isomerase/epimerase
MFRSSRRDFVSRLISLGGGAVLAGPTAEILAAIAEKSNDSIKLGLCTYLWGKDWDLPTVIANCTKAKVLAVELRTEHKHGVEPSINAAKRQEVKKRFADSPVVLLGMGTNECYHHVDPKIVQKSIERTKAFIRLSHDCGGSGVKVKPNDLPKGVPQQKTTVQIGRSLNELGKFATDYGQQIRLEVHGGCARLPIIREIMDVADHPNVAVCWNCNDEDLLDGGMERNFQRVKKRLGGTTHVRELDIGKYPYQQLISLLVKANYRGWVLLECRIIPGDGVAAMIHQRAVFDRMLAKA